MSFGGKNDRGPSIAELQRFIREKVKLHFLLANGEQIVGTLRWFDENAFQVHPANGEQPLTILRNAVIAYRRQDGQPTGGANSSAAAVKAPQQSAAQAQPAAEAKAAAATATALEDSLLTTSDSSAAITDAQVRADDIGGN
jgi:hypothetical protein